MPPKITLPKDVTDPIIPSAAFNANDEIFSKSLDNINNLQKLLLEGDTEKELPYGNRYLVETGRSSESNPSYHVVDNILYGKNEMNKIDRSKKGFLASYSETNVHPIYMNSNDASNVQVDLLIQEKNDDGNTISVTKSVKIPLSEYNNLSCTAFPNNCKKKDDETVCDNSCVVPTNDVNDPSYYNDQLAQAMSDNAAAEAELEASIDIQPISTVDDPFESFQCFYNRHSQSITNFREEPLTRIEYSDKSNSNSTHEIVIEQDMATALYIGSITAIGIFILGQFF